MFNNRSKAAFAAALLGTIYTIYLVMYFGASTEGTAGTIAFALVMPHFICNLLAATFGWVGFFKNRKGMVITSLVFYILAIVLFMLYFLFDLPMVILSAIAIGHVSRLQTNTN